MALGQITRLLQQFRNLEGASSLQLYASIENLNQTYQQFVDAQKDVLAHTGDAAIQYEEEQSVPAEEAYLEAKKLLDDALKAQLHSDDESIRKLHIHGELSSTPKTTPVNNTQEQQMILLQQQMLISQQQVNQLIAMLNQNQVREAEQPIARPLVPRVSIPKFSGDVTEWTQFHDLFSSLVGSDPRLTGSEKMHHLKNALTGDAEKLLRPFALSDANYAEAWATLQARYNNKRIIVAKHLDTLIDIPSCPKLDSKSLRKLVDTANESVRSLRVLQEPVDTWDTIIVHIVLRKVDSETRQVWEMDLTTRDGVSNLVNFTNFLDCRCRALENCVMSSQKPQHSSRRPPTSQSLVGSTVQTPCPRCTERHSLSSCSRYNALTIPKRKEFVTSKHLCYNCLSDKHKLNKCESRFNCRTCQKRHHSSIHVETTGQQMTPQANPATVQSNAATTSNSLPESVATLCSSSGRSNQQILLATAIVNIETIWGLNQSECLLIQDQSHHL